MVSNKITGHQLPCQDCKQQTFIWPATCIHYNSSAWPMLSILPLLCCCKLLWDRQIPMHHTHNCSGILQPLWWQPVRQTAISKYKHIEIYRPKLCGRVHVSRQPQCVTGSAFICLSVTSVTSVLCYRTLWSSNMDWRPRTKETGRPNDFSHFGLRRTKVYLFPALDM